MSGAMIIRMVLMGLVFLVWAVLMFRTLFELRRRAAEETGQMISGPGQFLHQIGIWLRAPEDKPQRGLLGFFTFAMIVMILVEAISAGA